MARHLAVHHPGGGHDVGAGLGLGQRRPGRSSSRVASLSTSPSVVEHAAVAVVGVLVEAEVGHEHEVVADLVAEVAQRDLDDAVGVPRLRALGVLVLGDAEEDDGGDAELGRARPTSLRSDSPGCAAPRRAARRWAGARRCPPARRAGRSGRRPTAGSRRPAGAGPACGAGGASGARGTARPDGTARRYRSGRRGGR